MQPFKRQISRIRWPLASLCLAAGLLTLLAGCTLAPRPTPAPSPTPTRTVTPSTPAATATPIATTPAIVTLTVWTIPRFAPGDGDAAARTLKAQAEAFVKAYPSYRLEWIIRPPASSGGVIDFLLSAHEVAPGILPDIAVLDTREMGAASRAGILQALDGVISDEIKSDLFPFARSATTIDGQWFGLPFEADVEHLLYNTKSMDAPPLTWTDVLSKGLRYGFAAGGENGRANDMFVVQYLARGGRLTDQNNQPVLDEAPLAATLAFYADGKRLKVLPETLIDLKSPEEVLPAYISNTLTLCNVRSDLYLAARAQLKNTGFAAIPTWNGAVASAGRARALVVVAPDAARLEAAKAFLAWFSDAERNAAWTRAAGRLPARLAALLQWDSSDSYAAFVRWQLASAQALPSTSEYDRVYLIMQQAVRDVWVGGVSPAEAARRAVAAVAGKG